MAIIGVFIVEIKNLEITDNVPKKEDLNTGIFRDIVSPPSPIEWTSPMYRNRI